MEKGKRVEVISGSLRGPAVVVAVGPVPGQIADRLRQAREQRGLSQRALAKLAGVSQAAVAAIERGAVPRVDTVQQLAEACQVSAAWLAFGA